jgi:hypothetical protein
VTFGQQRHIESTTTPGGMVETYLVGKNRFSGARGALNDKNAGFEKAAPKNRV